MIALDFTTFIGHFHPVFVHLPIGFILLAILLEWWENFQKKENSSNLISTAWFIGGIAALIATVFGWYLGETGFYEEEKIFIHRWLGIALVPIAFLGWWVKKNTLKYSRFLQHGFNVLLIILLSIEGHKGAILTHGDSYLTEYAPVSIKYLLASKKDSLLHVQLNDPDFVIVYNDLIQPIFNDKCVSCHNNNVMHGGLNMSHPDSLLLGGAGGDIISQGVLEDSELFRRITLPQKNRKFMPPTLNVLTYDEIKTIEWWIEKGASFEITASELGADKSMKSILLKRFGLNMEPRQWYEKVQIAPLKKTQIAKIESQGFAVNTLGANNALVDVSYSGKDLTKEKLQFLSGAKNHITWLSLTGTNVKDAWLAEVSNFINLTRLELDKTNVSDEGITYIKSLKHLEALNLYATQVTDASISKFQEMQGLKRVYLSRTNVTIENAKTITSDSGLNLIISEDFKN